MYLKFDCFLSPLQSTLQSKPQTSLLQVTVIVPELCFLLHFCPLSLFCTQKTQSCSRSLCQIIILLSPQCSEYSHRPSRSYMTYPQVISKHTTSLLPLSPSTFPLTVSQHSPQGLCTCYFLYLQFSSPTCPQSLPVQLSSELCSNVTFLIRLFQTPLHKAVPFPTPSQFSPQH